MPAVDVLELRRRKQLEQAAFRVQQELVDRDWVNERVVAAAVVHLQRSHYDAVVEERALNGRCGYPLCSTQLPDGVKSKYRIERTARGSRLLDQSHACSFCSNDCVAASIHLRSQIDELPLGIRAAGRQASPSPLTFLTHGTRCQSATPVVPDDAGRVVKERNPIGEPQPPEPDPDSRAHAVIEGYTIGTAGQLPAPGELKRLRKPNSASKTEKFDVFKQSQEYSVDSVDLISDKPRPDPWDGFEETLELALAQEKEIACSKHATQSAESSSAPAVDVAAAKVIKDTSQSTQSNVATDLNGMSSNTRDYFGRIHVTLKSWSTPATRTLLDVTSSVPWIDRVGSAELKNGGVTGNDPKLPPVDSHAQTRLRREIVLNRLGRAVAITLSDLGLPRTAIARDLAALVSTFELHMDAVAFGRLEWMAIAVVVLVALARHNPTLADAMSESQSGHNGTSRLEECIIRAGLTMDGLSELLTTLLDSNPLT